MDKSGKELFLELIIGCKAAQQEGSVWMTENPALHKLGEALIERGFLIETTEKYCAPGDKNRCFKLTDDGLEQTLFLTVGPAEIIEDDEYLDDLPTKE